MSFEKTLNDTDLRALSVAMSALVADSCDSRRAALYLGVSAHRMKRLIVQHRVEWPRGSVGKETT